MEETIRLLAHFVNEFHDIFIYLSKKFGLNLTDKQLHFWIIGVLGMICFILVHIFFTYISKFKWSIFALSFIYTLTIMIVLVFAIEIQQGITNRGRMEFEDAVMGLWGYLAFFIVYSLCAFIFYWLSPRKKRK